jgi:ATP-dependent protease ClpP protease subunit
MEDFFQSVLFNLSRFKVDERRQELERLERQIFPTSRTLIHQDSASSTDGAPSAMDDATARITTYLETAFGKLKAVTGKQTHLNTQTSSAVLL